MLSCVWCVHLMLQLTLNLVNICGTAAALNGHLDTLKWMMELPGVNLCKVNDQGMVVVY